MGKLHRAFSGQETEGFYLKPAALIVDVQSFDGMQRSDALAYKNALVKNLQELRDRHIPIIWVGIAAGGIKLLPPTEGDDPHAPRDMNELKEMGFFIGYHPDSCNRDIYDEFMALHGPRKGDVVYRKFSMSALAEVTDTALRDDILKESGVKFKSQRDDKDHPDTRYIEPDEEDNMFQKLFAGLTTLADYMREQSFNQTIIYGTVAHYCVTKTAEDAHRKGFNPIVASDMVLSWKYPDNDITGKKPGTLVWQAEQGSTSPFNHAALIEKAALFPLNLMPIHDAMKVVRGDGFVPPAVR